MLWRSEGHLKQDCEGQKKITVQNLKNRLDSGLKNPMQPRCHKEGPLRVFSTFFIHVREFSWLMIIIVPFPFQIVITSSKTSFMQSYTLLSSAIFCVIC